MAKIEPFESFSNEYDSWFIRNSKIYKLELDAIKTFIPSKSHGLEVGVGTGKFAAPLGIKMGVEPSEAMAKKAKEQGIRVFDGVAEDLPFSDYTFVFVLMVTTICFVDDIEQAFKEAFRVLKHNGFIVVAFVDKESELGKKYMAKKERNKFYKAASFFSCREVLNYLSSVGFSDFEIKQTLFPEDTAQSIENGFGKGSFVVIKGVKKLGQTCP